MGNVQAYIQEHCCHRRRDGHGAQETVLMREDGEWMEVIKPKKKKSVKKKESSGSPAQPADAAAGPAAGAADDSDFAEVEGAATREYENDGDEARDVLELGSRNAAAVVLSALPSLRDETGCHLDLGPGTTTLELTGPSSGAVARAAERVRDLLAENVGVEMTIENSKTRGAVTDDNLRSVQARTGTHIDVSHGPTHVTVSIMGGPDAAARARDMLRRVVDGEDKADEAYVGDVDLGKAGGTPAHGADPAEPPSGQGEVAASPVVNDDQGQREEVASGPGERTDDGGTDGSGGTAGPVQGAAAEE